MKIEKVSENQIRCTLTREDLIDRQLKLSELAYGSEKAKTLFRDMMQQASYEFGFEAEDIPLMIEAIPLSADCIILIITKVEDPEELDTRFSKFSPSTDEDEAGVDAPYEPEGADVVLDLFQQITQKISEKAAELAKNDEFIPLPESLAPSKKKTTKKPEIAKRPEQRNLERQNLTKVYVFRNYDSISRLAKVLQGYYKGVNSLYKNPRSGMYTMLINKSSHTPQEFNKICNVFSEYGTSEKYLSTTEARLREHEQLLIANHALQVLAEI